MSINPRKQSQFELFPGASQDQIEAGKSTRLTKDLTLPLENIIVLCIVFVMTLVLFFSFGVEKGKRVAMATDAPVTQGAIVAIQEVQAAAEGIVAPPVKERKPEQRVVFPVEVPRELTDESDTDFNAPVEIRQGPENMYTVQVASFKLETSARKEAERLKGAGHDDTFVFAKGNFSIVCIGKFLQHDEAKKFSNKLKNRYNDCLVRRM